MAQVKKLANGGKPKNLKEYDEEKKRVEEENARKQKEADLNSILINGKKYSLSEAKEKLGTWRGSQEAMDLRTSYGRRGRDVDSAYKRFLDIIDSGRIAAINFNSDNGFDIQYKKDIDPKAPIGDRTDLDLSDKYASDYVASAIRSNLLNLSQNNPQLEEVSRIDLNYNPQAMLTREIWGREINPDTYGAMTEAQRTADVIRTLEANRDRYNEYFTNPDAFNLEEELPFTSMQEYDQFLDNLRSLNDANYEKNADGSYKLDANGNRIYNFNKSNWDENEVINDRRMGGFWKDYIFGTQQTPPASRKEDDNNPPASKDQTKIDSVRQTLGIKEDQESTAGINISNDGTIIDSKGNPYTGYYDGRPYGGESGWIVGGEWQGDTQTAFNYVHTLDVNDPRRQAFEAERQGYRDRFAQLQAGRTQYNEDAGKYNILGQLNFAFPDLNLQSGKDYIIENYSDRIPESTIINGENYSPEDWSIINLYNNTFDDTVSPIQNPLGSFMINNQTGEIQRVGIGWNTDTREAYLTNPEGERLYGYGAMYPEAQSYAGSAIDAQKLNQLAQNAYQAVFNNWSTRMQEIAEQLGAVNPTNETITALKNMGYTDVQIDYMLKYIKAKSRQRMRREALINGIDRFQVGGKIIGTTTDTKTRADIDDIFDWGALSNADKVSVVGLATDLVGLAASVIPGYGNVVGGASGILGTIAQSISSGMDQDGYTWSDFGNTALNLGLDAATFIPGLGTFAKAGKLARVSKKALNTLRTVLVGVGLTNVANAVTNWVTTGNLSVDDARLIANGLTPMIASSRRAIQTNKYTKVVGDSRVGSPYTVQTKNKSFTLDRLTEDDVNQYKSLKTKAERENFIKGKLRSNEDFLNNLATTSGKKRGTPEFNTILDQELESITLPGSRWSTNPKDWVNPHRMTTQKNPNQTRELKADVKKGLLDGKYGWYKKAAIEEAVLKTNTRGFRTPIRTDLEGNTNYTKVTPGERNPFTGQDLNVESVQRRPTLSLPQRTQTSTDFEAEVNRRSNQYNTEVGAENQQREINVLREALFPTPLRSLPQKGTITPAEELANYHKLKRNQDVLNYGRTVRKENLERQAETKARAARQQIKINNIREQDLEYKREGERLRKLGEQLQRDRARQREREDIVKYNKEQQSKSQNALRKADEKDTKRKSDAVKRKENKPKKKTSNDIGERVRRHEDGGVIKLQQGNKFTTFNFNNGTTMRVPFLYNYNNPYSSTYQQEAPYTLNSFSNNGTTSVVSSRTTPSFNDYIASSYRSRTAPMTTQPNIEASVPSDLAPMTTTYNNVSANNLTRKNTRTSIPLTTISSITSLVSKNKANNDIFNILNKGLKPTIFDLPKQINYNIQGNEGVRSAYYNQAADLMNLGRKPLTSDADRQLAYNLELAKNAGNLRIQGDLANEQALQQSREKAFNINYQNQRDREKVAMQNADNIQRMKNAKVQLDAQRRAQRAQNFDTFLHDVTEQVKQRAGENQQIDAQMGLMNLRAKNYDQSIDDSMKRRSIESELMQPNLTSDKRDELYKSLQEIAKRQFLQSLKEQNYQLESMRRQVW